MDVKEGGVLWKSVSNCSDEIYPFGFGRQARVWYSPLCGKIELWAVWGLLKRDPVSFRVCVWIVYFLVWEGEFFSFFALSWLSGEKQTRWRKIVCLLMAFLVYHVSYYPPSLSSRPHFSCVVVQFSPTELQMCSLEGFTSDQLNCLIKWWWVAHF